MTDDEFISTPEIAMRFRILHAIDRSLDEITVKDICRQAGISRYTFYHYFETKYEIPIWHGMFVQRFYLDEIGRTIDWRTGYFHDFRMLSEEREFYDRAMHYTVRDFDSLGQMEEHRRDVILKTLEEYRHVRTDDDLMFCIDSFVTLETYLVARWLRDGLKPEPAVMADRMLLVVPPKLFDAMEL